MTPWTALLVAALTPAPSSADAGEVARRVEQHHRRVRDLTARFTQTYRSLLLGREVVERGTLRLKPPGRMLWEYRDPEKKVFVSDGKKSYFYVPADRQVIVRENAGERGIAMDLLSGRSDILSEFEVTLLDPREKGSGTEPRLRLTPRKPDPDLEEATVAADESGRIREIEILDTQGNRSRFQFESVRENAGLPDSIFDFRIPSGVEVISRLLPSPREERMRPAGLDG